MEEALKSERSSLETKMKDLRDQLEAVERKARVGGAGSQQEDPAAECNVGALERKAGVKEQGREDMTETGGRGLGRR